MSLFMTNGVHFNATNPPLFQKNTLSSLSLHSLLTHHSCVWLAGFRPLRLHNTDGKGCRSKKKTSFFTPNTPFSVSYPTPNPPSTHTHTISSIFYSTFSPPPHPLPFPPLLSFPKPNWRFACLTKWVASTIREILPFWRSFETFFFRWVVEYWSPMA